MSKDFICWFCIPTRCHRFIVMVFQEKLAVFDACRLRQLQWIIGGSLLKDNKMLKRCITDNAGEFYSACWSLCGFKPVNAFRVQNMFYRFLLAGDLHRWGKLGLPLDNSLLNWIHSHLKEGALSSEVVSALASHSEVSDDWSLAREPPTPASPASSCRNWYQISFLSWGSEGNQVWWCRPHG